LSDDIENGNGFWHLNTFIYSCLQIITIVQSVIIVLAWILRYFFITGPTSLLGWRLSPHRLFLGVCLYENMTHLACFFIPHHCGLPWKCFAEQHLNRCGWWAFVFSSPGKWMFLQYLTVSTFWSLWVLDIMSQYVGAHIHVATQASLAAL
jgi:hypothetical protein